MLKPVLANMLGAMGENLHFFLFPAQDRDGHRRVDATREGALTVRLGDEDFRWWLPLASLAVPKICPVDGERMNGAWKYCPWHGKALREEKLSHQP